jgi:chemosensory pili system protein ChpA (sensor histidine kinase/response regulator)
MPHPSIETENPVAGAKDLGPLVWVLNDLRQSIPMATMALCRAAKESRSAARMGEGWPDDSSLLAAQHQFEQAAGALAIVGQLEAAKICAAATAATAVFIQKPAACTEEAAASIHRAGQAVINFLQARLTGIPILRWRFFRATGKSFLSAAHSTSILRICGSRHGAGRYCRGQRCPPL